MVASYLSGQRLYRDVVFYARMGEHRTASDVDLRTSDWVAERLEQAGLRTSFLPWRTRQFFVEESGLRVGGEQVECFPLWFPRETGPRPVRAQLAMARPGQENQLAAGRIAVLDVAEPRESGGLPVLEGVAHAAARAGVPAVVVVTGGPSGEIYAHNQAKLEPLPVPVVLVAPRDRFLVVTAAEAGAEGEILVRGRDEPAAEARNVLGRSGPESNVIVVSTPSSGWFQCAGERGSGVALFIALAHWVCERQPPLGYVFTCNSGHELSSLGMQHFLASGETSPERVLGWLHLGASIGTVGWEPFRSQPGAKGVRTLGGTADMRPLLERTFADFPGLETTDQPLGAEPPHLVAAGYRRWASVAGMHPYFHTRADHPEIAATPERLESVGQALIRTLEAVEQLPKR